jgi:hypothetical protein
MDHRAKVTKDIAGQPPSTPGVADCLITTGCLITKP